MKLISNLKKSNNYRSRVHSLIPGGSHTYSKGDGQFPEISPAAIKKGSGAYVWDVDDNKYLDCSMGLGCVTLGHAFSPIIDKIKDTLESGVNFQRPSYLELETAEKFIDLIPGHDMVKFAKNGSSVTTAAVKLARAATGRTLVAFPSDHPFYSYDDWFIGKTACSRGVPHEVQELSVTFKSYDINSLRELFSRYPDQIACVITEPQKHEPIPNDYLEKAIKLCHDEGALFVADEMVTGFKAGFPGACANHGVVPDLSTWGKATANGFSFCALTGKKEFMDIGGIKKKGSEFVFLISTTHGGETTALSAAMATIDYYKENNVIDVNHATGKEFLKIIDSEISKSEMKDFIQLVPCHWLPIFQFKNRSLEYCAGLRTLFLQEMIKRGVLFQGCLVPSFSHTNDDLHFFAEAFRESLKIYGDALEGGYEKFLVGEPCKPVFRKYI